MTHPHADTNGCIENPCTGAASYCWDHPAPLIGQTYDPVLNDGYSCNCTAGGYGVPGIDGSGCGTVVETFMIFPSHFSNMFYLPVHLSLNRVLSAVIEVNCNRGLFERYSPRALTVTSLLILYIHGLTQSSSAHTCRDIQRHADFADGRGSRFRICQRRHINNIEQSDRREHYYHQSRQ